MAAMILLSGCRPLWLDEILQLLYTRDSSPTQMVSHLGTNPGASPLGYLTQQIVLKIFGYSIWSARLPAAVFGGAALVTTILLAGELGLASGWTGWIFAALPLNVRYATEARMYSQALFFSVLATLLYVRMTKKPGWKPAAVYGLTIAIAAYTQPYSVSVGMAHILWSLVYRERKSALLGGIAFVTAVLAYLPWYFWSKDLWRIGTPPDQHFSASLKTPLMLFRELAGGGYWVSGLLVILCALALARGTINRRNGTLLILLIGVPLLSVFAGDAWFSYFLAARQFIWVLPAIAILAGNSGWRNHLAPALLGLLLMVSACQSMRYFIRPSENWQAAADVIAARIQAGACLSVAPSDHLPLYEFFRPGLHPSPCHCSQWILALTPYSTAQQRDTALREFRRQGYRPENETFVGGTTIVRFRRQLLQHFPTLSPPIRSGPGHTLVAQSD